MTTAICFHCLKQSDDTLRVSDPTDQTDQRTVCRPCWAHMTEGTPLPTPPLYVLIEDSIIGPFKDREAIKSHPTFNRRDHNHLQIIKESEYGTYLEANKGLSICTPEEDIECFEHHNGTLVPKQGTVRLTLEKAKKFIDSGAPGWVGFTRTAPATDDDAIQLLDAGWSPSIIPHTAESVIKWVLSDRIRYTNIAVRHVGWLTWDYITAHPAYDSFKDDEPFLKTIDNALKGGILDRLKNTIWDDVIESATGKRPDWTYTGDGTEVPIGPIPVTDDEVNQAILVLIRARFERIKGHIEDLSVDLGKRINIRDEVIVRLSQDWVHEQTIATIRKWWF